MTSHIRGWGGRAGRGLGWQLPDLVCCGRLRGGVRGPALDLLRKQSTEWSWAAGDQPEKDLRGGAGQCRERQDRGEQMQVPGCGGGELG